MACHNPMGDLHVQATFSHECSEEMGQRMGSLLTPFYTDMSFMTAEAQQGRYLGSGASPNLCLAKPRERERLHINM